MTSVSRRDGGLMIMGGHVIQYAGAPRQPAVERGKTQAAQRSKGISVIWGLQNGDEAESFARPHKHRATEIPWCSAPCKSLLEV